jgi:excinuclease UvrABC nuclease subunit
MKKADLLKKKLPDAPGVYFFLGTKKQILYIGKATSLRNRVRSYFSSD